MASRSTDVSLDRAGAVGVISLTTPGTVPILDADACVLLTDRLREAEADPALHVLVLRGGGKGFCAGADLAYMHALDVAERERAVLDVAGPPLVHALRTLHASRLLTVAAVHGVAAGAGLGIALACDLLVMGRSARLATGFTKVGLTPDTGVTYFLARDLGYRRALAMCLRGEVVGAERAQDLGLATDVVDDDALVGHVDDLARSLASGQRRTFAETKTLLRHASAATLEAQMDLEFRAVADALGRPEFEEGAGAFLGGRAPDWEGTRS